MGVNGGNILFFDVIMMPHSIRMHHQLVEAGYQVNYWYYKNLTALYPWNSLASGQNYFVYKSGDDTIYKLLKQSWNSDLVVICGWPTAIHLFLGIFCFVFNIRYAYWTDAPEKQPIGIKFPFKWLLIKMAGFLLVTGKEGINRISTFYRIDQGKFRDFPYLSAKLDEDLIKFNNDKRIRELKEGAKIKILISNRFEKRKGYESIYLALKITDKEVLEKYSFTIIGSGTEFEEYKRKFTSLGIDLKFNSWVEYEEYLNIVQESDILIHASLHEPFGIPPIDAMACGKLVIASDRVMSTYDRIKNGESGYIYKAGDHRELSEILSSVAKNTGVIYEIGAKAFGVSKKYDFMKNLEVIDQIFKIKRTSDNMSARTAVKMQF